MNIKENMHLRSIPCPACDNENISDDHIFCVKCGIMLFNLCSDEQCNYINPEYAYYCGLCGSETIFNQKDIVIDIDDQ